MNIKRFSICLGIVAMLTVGLAVDAFAQTKQKKKKQDDKVELKVGDEAPDWELPGSDGKTYKLSDFKDKKAVIVAWYPKAHTGG